MAINAEYKQFCIIDAISIVALCRIEIGLKRAMEWLLDDLAISLCKTALDEAEPYISKLDDEEAKRVFTACQLSSYRGNLKKAIEFLDPHVKNFGRIGPGERESASLALELSRLHTQYVTLVTDDFRAHPVIGEAFCKHQIGGVYSSYDLLTFIYTRHTDIPHFTCEQSIKDLTAILLEGQPADREKRTVPDEKLLQYLELLQRGMYRIQ